MEFKMFVGLVVVLELDTTAKYQGVLEEYDEGHVKVVNGEETWWIPEGEIARIDLVKSTDLFLH